MTIKEVYQLAIEEGIKHDFRGKDGIDKRQQRIKKRYEKMSPQEKEEYDTERLTNPYSDSRVLYGDPDREVKKILVGIDIGGEELFLAKHIGGVDLVISHHPRGVALSGLDDVMELQVDMMEMLGIPVNVAEKLIHKRIQEVARGISSANHNRVVDTARHLDIPLMAVHTPCDNIACTFVENKLKKDKPHSLGDVIDSLKEIPEYKEAGKIGAGPKIFVGGKENRAGKIVLTEMTGGTEGAPEIYEQLARAGVGTVVGMHISEKHRLEAEKAFVNVVIAGHISSDSIGVNILMDKIEKQGVEIIPCSGLIRVKR